MSGALTWGAVGILAGDEAEIGAPFGPIGWLIAGAAIVATVAVAAVVMSQGSDKAVSEPIDGAQAVPESIPKTEPKAEEKCQGSPKQPPEFDPEKAELDRIGPLKGLTPEQIAEKLKKLGYDGPLAGDNDGDIFIKNLPNGRSVRVRVDPAEVRKNPKGWADEKSHVHKEGVDTGTSNEDTASKSAKNPVRYDDSGCASDNPEDIHIPTKG